jgi:hypothetical protein
MQFRMGVCVSAKETGMVRSNLPVYIQPSKAVGDALGPDIAKVALLAIRSILKNRRGIEVACQQIEYQQHWFALSSRITVRGDLVINIEIGDPRLADRLILEDELRSAERQHRDRDRDVRDAELRLRNGRRRW